MRLSEAEFQELVDCLDAEEPLPGIDCRNLPRIFVNSMITIRMEADYFAPMQIRVNDISATGLGVVMPRALPAGQRFLAELEREKQPPLTVVCEVRHCDETAHGTFHIGVQFVNFTGVQ